VPLCLTLLPPGGRLRRYDRNHGHLVLLGCIFDAMKSTMLRRWWDEHGELDELVENLQLELRRGALSAAKVSIQCLTTRLEGHFVTEEELYLPMIERVSPQGTGLLQSLRSGHRALRKSLEDLLALVEMGGTTSARRALAVLRHRLYRHEIEEVDLIAELDRLADRARSAPILH
jgi:hypothetical protein